MRDDRRAIRGEKTPERFAGLLVVMSIFLYFVDMLW